MRFSIPHFPLLLFWSIFALFIGGSSSSGKEITPLQEFRNSPCYEVLSGEVPREWGERLEGICSRFETEEKLLALTLDACGGNTPESPGFGYDGEIIELLRKLQVPATLFINGRWAKKHPELTKELGADPLFEIGNHGLRHRPASCSGRSAYGIPGTASLEELLEEIEANGLLLEHMTGEKPGFYRSGTAYYDEVAVQAAVCLGYAVGGYSVLGDAGATFSAAQVEKALLQSRKGDIILCHFNHPEGETAEGLAEALPKLLKRGFRFIRLSEIPPENRRP